MDHHAHYHRNRDGLPQFAAMDSLDLNLHLAPPLGTMNSATPLTYPSPPPPPPLLRQPSMGHPGIYNFQSLETPQPRWRRFFLDATSPSPSPPSPGEIELGNNYFLYHRDHYSQSPPFWGMDLSDIDTAGQDLDLDHFLREDDEELEAALLEEDGHQFDLYQDGGINWDDWWGRSTGSTTDRLNSSGRTTQAAAGSVAAAAEAPQSSVAAASKSSPDLPKKKNSASTLSLESQQQQQEQQNYDNRNLGDDGRDRQQRQEQQPQSSGKDFFFDCNVCFDVANEPVVTSCGHLVCWPCLYQWLHVHSHNDECPVCKGAVSDADIIPIYGRGGGGGGDGGGDKATEGSCSSASILGQHIPPRPRARRTDSRQPAVDVALTEMLRWRRFMRMWHSRLMMERRGGVLNGVRRPAAGVPYSFFPLRSDQWPYDVENLRRM